VKAIPDQANACVSCGQAAASERTQSVDLFELAPIVYLRLGVGHIILQANLAAEDLLGLHRERLLGANFGSFIADHCRPVATELLTQAMASGITQSGEIELSRDTQPPMVVMLTAMPGRAASECLVTMTDVSLRRLAAEEELRELKARFSGLDQMSYNFYWNTDVEHRITATSQVGRRNGQRYPLHAAGIGMRRWDMPHLSPDETGWGLHRAALASRVPFRNFEFSRLGLDGAEQHLSISGDPLFNACGEFVGYHGLGQDITERKLAERALRESEERYRSLFANAGDGILIVSRDGLIIAANESFARMHGYSVQEIMTTSLKALVTPETFRSAPERWRRIVSGELMTVEAEHCHKDGHVFPVEISASVISSGNQTYMQFFYRDITERKRNEAALLAANRSAESANRAKTRFLAAASHDLRQPVQAINLFLDALAQTKLSDEQKEITAYLGMSVRGLRELLNTLLDISQLDAGVVKPDLMRVAAADLLRELEVEFAPIASGKNLRLRLFARRDLMLITDPGLLLRALRNIVGNAIKYTEQGGVLIGARRRGAHAMFQVWDTGIGIAPEHIGHIFEEYFQIGNHARDRTKGIGLGLSIVKRLVSLIDGDVVCRSQSGRGAAFEISLPRACASQLGGGNALPQAIADSGALELSGIIGRQVVVIEDDSLVAKGLERALAALGATVALFSNAEEALASSAAAAADLYITDFHLPGPLNGIELLNAIQRRSATAINAVVITAETASNRVALSASSNWKVLSKPIDLRALLSAM